MKRIALVILITVIPALLFAQQELESIMTLRPFDEYRDNIHAGGDINGDGYDDIVIAERVNDFVLPRVAIYFGGSTPDTIPDHIITEENNNHRGGFGSSISYNGDINGDGFDDLVISDNYYSEVGYGDVGRVYIYFGSTNFDTEADVILYGADYVDDWLGLYFGVSDISGDLNNDGYYDLVISSFGSTVNYFGYIHVFYGGELFDTECDWHKRGDYMELLGLIYSIGDINGDNYDDIVSVNLTENAEMIPMEIYAGGEEMQDEPVWSTEIYNSGTFILPSAYSDINNDGCDDIMLNNDDKVALYYGESNFNITSVEFKPDVYHISNLFQCNINNDEFVDIVVSTECVEQYDYKGKTMFYYGSTDFDTIPDMFLYGTIPHSYFGKKGFNIGDINNDSNNDIIIGTNNMNPDNAGDSLIIYTEEYVQFIEGNKTIIGNNNISIDNYPNPFRSKTSISFNIPKEMRDANISIYNVRGQLVKTLISGGNISGAGSIIWDGTNNGGGTVSSGLYFCKIKVGGVEYAKKLLMSK